MAMQVNFFKARMINSHTLTGLELTQCCFLHFRTQSGLNVALQKIRPAKYELAVAYILLNLLILFCSTG